ncbi:protein mono-ADP-ribosyltransferase PARP10 isoform X1 [Scleropages formosus]|uniref:protein mono-ADP-ribosyltransferase PARP10 isoform X1 n=1 Tax=Scleropages formosus TaxID=113540 RepID=UPI0010FA6752|nr:protein mono-ADP-ribosyltransferase PARP10 isoform X1 [Scleropages formosus]
MSDDSLEERTVEVVDIPADLDDEFLCLYFENKRRSGGGTVASFQRNGSRAVLVFEETQVAERVLSKGPHVVQNAKLLVRRKAPKDSSKLLLRGINPRTSLELIELYVENVTGVDCENYHIYLSLGSDLALVHFHEPISDFQNVFAKIARKPLDSAHIHPEQVEQTDSILVQNLPPGIAEDMIVLYFESKRSGGANVREFSIIKDGVARVSFEDVDAVQRILGKSHKLEESDLIVQPFYDFLQTIEHMQTENLVTGRNEGLGLAQNEGVGQVEMSPALDLYTAHVPIPEPGAAEEDKENVVQSEFSTCITLSDPLKLQLFKASKFLTDLQKSNPTYEVNIMDMVVEITGPSQLGTEKLKGQLLEFFTGFAQIHVTFDMEKSMFLSKVQVKDWMLQALEQQGLPSMYTVSDCVVTVMSLSLAMVERVCKFIKSSVIDFSVGITPEYECMLYSNEWSEFLNSLDFCSAKISDRGDKIEVLTLKGMEEEKRSNIIEFLSTPVQTEIVISMEPGMLKYIQIHCDQILADMDQVSILPLESKDVSGFRLYGNTNACRMADEVLRSIVSSILSKKITINQPGVARFLVQEEGTSILKEMQTKFEVYISLEKVHWEPLENENIFDSAWKLTSQQNFCRNSSDGCHNSGPHLISVNASDSEIDASSKGLIEEAKKLVSVIHQESASSLIKVPNFEEEEDLYTAAEEGCFSLSSNSGSQVADSTTPAAEVEQPDTEALSLKTPCDLDEDAALSLAIQYSMEQNNNRAQDEDDELQRALELSMKMDQQTGPAADSQLNKAIHMSLQDALRAANSAEILVFARYSHDLIRVDIALGKKIGMRQCEEKVEHKCLKSLSEHQRKCIDFIRRKHAVEIQIQGTTATVSGFKDYVTDAVSDMKQLVRQLSNTVSDAEILRTVQWVWHDAQSQPIPYPDNATIFIEHSWKVKEKKIDIVFDNQPYIIDFEKMQEYSIASGKSVPIERKILGSGAVCMEAQDEDYSLLSNLSEASRVDEDSDEFQDVVKNFYDTIQDHHNKIKIVKVDKIVNNLLLSQYKLKKTSILQSASEMQVERTLYHGTSETSVKEICIHGFNRSFCGKNATVYGQGVYFAVNSSISVQDQYSPPNADGHKFVFVTKVLTGDFTKGKHEMKAAPLKDSSEIPLRYHSVTDNVESPTLFVIFNDTQAYPEYLITCQKIHG